LKNKDEIKNTIISKFKDKLWDDKELEKQNKLIFYKEVINPTLANQNYLSILTSAKKKINIAKIRIIFMSFEVKPNVGLFLKLPRTKESASFVILRRLKMTSTFS